MKKNLLIMMMMVLCAGFVSAQTINTVRGFVPGGSTDGNNATYVVFGQPFSAMSDATHTHEVMASLAQMQIVSDTTVEVITYGEVYHANGFDLTFEEVQAMLQLYPKVKDGCDAKYMNGYLKRQVANGATNTYYYDTLIVVDLYICPEKANDGTNDYDVIALNQKCWFKSNMRKEGGMLYESELNSDVNPETYGLLYTWEAALNGTSCENGYVQGICPDGWHLPTAEEVEPLFVLPAENLRVNGNWIVNGNNNLIGFSAEPAGFFNSTSNRFEGLFSETDFWYVNSSCETDVQQADIPTPGVLQITYYCNTPLNPERNLNDGLSVRCVYDVIGEFAECDPIEDGANAGSNTGGN